MHKFDDHSAFRAISISPSGSRKGYPMFQRNLTGQRFAAIFMLGWLLFNYPLLSLFNDASTWFGIPVLYAYLFFAWALIIGLLACVAEKLTHSESHEHGDAATLTAKD
ncbi:MAG: hypothetical protein ABIO19_12120 [Burkholderiaceae bacterium]